MIRSVSERRLFLVFACVSVSFLFLGYVASWWKLPSDEEIFKNIAFSLTETDELREICEESFDLTNHDLIRMKYGDRIPCSKTSHPVFDEIENDFRPFLEKGGISRDYFDEMLDLRFQNHPGESLLVQYIDNELYLGIGTPRHPHATRCLRSFLSIFTFMMRVFPLPNNIEFLVSFLAKDQDYDLEYPVLSYCRRKDGMSKHILYPRIYFNEFGKWSMYHRERLDNVEGYAWSNKKNSSVFRGVSTHRERVQLSLLSLENPELIDSKITKMITHYAESWPEYHDKTINNIITSEYLPMRDQLAWKYIINIDGVGCADRFSNLLISNSAILKVESPYEEYWYRHLVEFEDYIPVGMNDDLIKKLKWLVENDEIGEKIARKSTEKIKEMLTTDSIFCYFYFVVSKYKEIMNYIPVVRSDLVVHVPKDICHDLN